MAFAAPNYTQIPNDLFDHWIPHLKEGELKVLLVIMRKTLGWHKIRDKISLSQLEKATGLTRTNILIATDSLQDKGIILKETLGINGSQETYYELIITENSNNSYQSCNNTPPSPAAIPPPVLQKDPQKKQIKKIHKETTTDVDVVVPFKCLDLLNVSPQDKINLSKRHSEKDLQKIIDYIKNPDFKRKGTLEQAFFYFLKNPSHMIVSKEEEKKQENEQKIVAAKKISSQWESKHFRVDILSKGIEIVPITGMGECICINYSENGFLDQLENAIRKKGFTRIK